MQADESKVKALESIFGGQDITASVIRTVLTSNENKFDDAVDSLLNMSNEIDSNRPGQRKEEDGDEETLLDKKEREKISTLENMFGNDLSKSVICTVLESNKGELVDTVDTLLNMTSKDINPNSQRREQVNPRDSERLRQEEEIRAYEEYKALQIRLQEEEARAVKETQKRELEAREAQKRAEVEAAQEAARRSAEEARQRAAIEAAREQERRAQLDRSAREMQIKAEKERAELETRNQVELAHRAAVAEQERILREYEAALKRKEEEQMRLFEEQQRKLQEQQQHRRFAEEQQKRQAEKAQRREQRIAEEERNVMRAEEQRKIEEVAEMVRQQEMAKYQAKLEAQRASEMARRKAEEEERTQLRLALSRAEMEKAKELERVRSQEAERERLANQRLVAEEKRMQERLHEEEREAERQRRVFEEERTKMLRERERMEAVNEVMRREQEERLRAECEAKAALEMEARRQAEAAQKLAEEVKRLELKEQERVRIEEEKLKAEEEMRRREEQERLMREEEEQRRVEYEREMKEKEERERIEEEERRKKAAYDSIAASAIFITPKSAVSNENAITVTASVDNTDITCTWDLPDGTAAPTNWLGLYPVRQNNNKKYVQFVYTNGAGTGSHVFHGVTPGHYEVRFYTTKSYEQIASQSKTVRVGPTPTLGTQLQGDTLRVHYTLTPFSTPPTSDWLGIYEKGQRRNKKYVSTAWGNAEGQVLMKPPRTPGVYEVRLFASGAKYNEQAVSEFIVEDNDCIRIEQTSALSGANITACWVVRTLEPSSGDWIGVYKAEEEPNSSNYLSCTYTQGASVGQTTIQAPKEPGVYELRLFAKAKGKYLTHKKSEPLTIV